MIFFVVPVFCQEVNSQVYEKVQKRLKAPNVFYTFPQSMVKQVNEILKQMIAEGVIDQFTVKHSS